MDRDMPTSKSAFVQNMQQKRSKQTQGGRRQPPRATAEPAAVSAEPLGGAPVEGMGSGGVSGPGQPPQESRPSQTMHSTRGQGRQRVTGRDGTAGTVTGGERTWRGSQRALNRGGDGESASKLEAEARLPDTGVLAQHDHSFSHASQEPYPEGGPASRWEQGQDAVDLDWKGREGEVVANNPATVVLPSPIRWVARILHEVAKNGNVYPAECCVPSAATVIWPPVSL